MNFNGHSCVVKSSWKNSVVFIVFDVLVLFIFLRFWRYVCLLLIGSFELVNDWRFYSSNLVLFISTWTFLPDIFLFVNYVAVRWTVMFMWWLVICRWKKKCSFAWIFYCSHHLIVSIHSSSWLKGLRENVLRRGWNCLARQ